VEGVLLEVGTMTEEFIFEWHSLDFVDPYGGYVLSSTTNVSDDRLTKDTAWDSFSNDAVDETACI